MLSRRRVEPTGQGKRTLDVLMLKLVCKSVYYNYEATNFWPE
jgi:hypothetical protein